MPTSNSRPSILVTRPEPGASVTAEKLRELGFDVIVQPFTEMAGLPVPDLITKVRSVDAGIVTSANALRFLDSVALEALSNLKLFCVGDATMQMAQELGFSDVHSADGDGLALIKYVRSHLHAPANLIYLCGVTRTPEIEENLGRDFKITVGETYKTHEISQLTDKINNVFIESAPSAVLFYSGVSAEIFKRVLKQSTEIQLTDKTKLFCISQRAKSKLPVHLQEATLVCDKPNDDAMIRMAKKYFDQA